MASMNQPVDLSIILPSYLEEENLRILLPRIRKSVTKFTSSFEILVVDTEKQMDGTRLVCNENDVLYFNRAGGNSYGSAIRTGISKSRGKKIIFMDADGSHYPDFIGELYKEKDNADVIIASRYIEGGHTENNRYLVLMSRMVNFGYSFILNIKCKDVSNSFKLYSGDNLRKLTLTCENFDIVEEILYKLIRQNKKLNIKEIPFTFKQRMFGETKRNLAVFVFTYFVTLIRLRFFT